MTLENRGWILKMRCIVAVPVLDLEDDRQFMAKQGG